MNTQVWMAPVPSMFFSMFLFQLCDPKKKKKYCIRKWFLVTVRKVGRCVTVHAVDRGKKRNDPFALCYDCGYSFARIKWFYPIVVLVANKNEKKNIAKSQSKFKGSNLLDIVILNVTGRNGVFMSVLH